jgi:serine O-acetyltransferase
MKHINEEINLNSKHQVFERNKEICTVSLDRAQVGRWADELFEWLFCIKPLYASENTFLAKEVDLKRDLQSLTERVKHIKANPGNFVSLFFNKLPAIHKILKSDLEAIFSSDPAAESLDEILLAYPGFYAITVHRIAHELWTSGLPVIPRLLSEYAHGKTGIDIHPAARIGKRFLIDHGTGIVIGGTSVIGNDVKIYQGVTLGALSVSRGMAETKRHPTIGNRVVIYANATILGGHTFIGDDSVIGGNVWITHSIPNQSMVFHKSEIIIKNNSDFPEPLNFVI